MSAPPSSGMPAWLENAWLDRYLERKLDADETAWFEGYVLDKPHLLRQIEADSDLRDGLALQPGARDTVARADSRVVPLARPGADHGRRPPRWLALAASLALGVGAGWFATRMAVEAPDAAVVASPPRIVFDTLRGEAAPARVEHAATAASVVIVDIAVPSTATDITLVLQPDTSVTLKAGPEGFATAIVPESLARPGTTAELRYRDGDNQVSRPLPWPAR